jgi:Ni/Fe-hydrogenase subunit HybB-like protein
LGPTIIAVSVLIGTALDRIRLYVAAYSVSEQAPAHELQQIPSAIAPSAYDILIWIGAISGCILIYLLTTKVFPIINIWEQKELLLYKYHKKFHRTEVLVLGKPD